MEIEFRRMVIEASNNESRNKEVGTEVPLLARQNPLET